MLTNQDEEQLAALMIGHYVVAGLAVVFALFGVIQIPFLWLMFDGRLGQTTPPMPPAFAWMMILFSAATLVGMTALAVLVCTAGRCLRRCVRYRLCLVAAGAMCVFTPFGTVLGVLTLLVLQRQTVKDAFAATATTSH